VSFLYAIFGERSVSCLKYIIAGKFIHQSIVFRNQQTLAVDLPYSVPPNSCSPRMH